MGCLKLSILDKQYKKTELKVSYRKKELTVDFCDWNMSSTLFNAKELDDESGLYYYEARYYDPKGTFTSRDPLFEKYFWISPYAYCGNNPVARIDPDGRDWVEVEVKGNKEVYYDRKVKSQADVNKKYGENSGVRHLADGSKVGNGQYTVYNDHKNNKNGVVKDANGNVVNNDRTIIYGKNYTIFAGVTDKSVNAETLHKNLFGTSYTGGNNPKDYEGSDNYDYIPKNMSELASIRHDKAYDAANAGIFYFKTINADLKFAAESFMYSNPSINPDPIDRARAIAGGIFFGIVGGVRQDLKPLKNLMKKYRDLERINNKKYEIY